jgi:hypothetical protein
MLRLFLALTATVVLGLASRLHPVGWYFYDRALGEVLYAVAAYLALAMIFLHKPPWFIAVLAFACCLAVELFKLTGIPAEYQHVFLVHWFLGMIFSWLNLVYYLIGARLLFSVGPIPNRSGIVWRPVRSRPPAPRQPRLRGFCLLVAIYTIP